MAWDVNLWKAGAKCGMEKRFARWDAVIPEKDVMGGGYN
jgi:hypothetical protein